MKNAMFSMLFLLAVMTASAQPKALGVRMGTEIQLSYEHGVGTRGDFLEVDMGYELIRLVNLAAAYDFMVARPEWTSKGNGASTQVRRPRSEVRASDITLPWEPRPALNTRSTFLFRFRLMYVRR